MFWPQWSRATAPISPPPPECVPRGWAFPCAGRQRNARLHPLRKCAGPVPTKTQKTAQLCQLPPECSASGRDGGAAGGSDRLHAVRPPGRGGRVDQRAGRLGLRPGGCADLPWRSRCADDRRQQLRVCDIGFELSYAAVLGTLAGVALARRSAERREEKRRRNKKTAGKCGGVLANCLRQQGAAVWETLCVSGCACMATFPVLVLRGLSTSCMRWSPAWPCSGWSNRSSCWGWRQHSPGWPRRWSRCTGPRRSGRSSGGPARPLALWVSGWPGAQIYFDTAYAALVCLLLAALLGLAWHWNIRLRRRCLLCCSQRRLPSGPETPSAGTWSAWNWWAVKWLRRSSSRRTTGPSCSTGAGRPPGKPWRRRWNAAASGRWKRSSTCGWTRRNPALSVQSRSSGQPGWPRIRPKRSGPTRRRWKSCAHRPAVQCGSPSRGSRL